VTVVPEQTDVTPVSTRGIFKSKEFRAGVEDVRSGRLPRFDDPIAASWDYERGRQWASLAPMRMPLKIRGKVNTEAFLLLARLMKERAIL
jgi:hypothetical protein